MVYVSRKDASYGGLGRIWGLGAEATPVAAAPSVAAPTTAGATAVAAGSGVIAAPVEAARTYPSYPGYPGYPGYPYPGYPGLPVVSGGIPTIMQAPAAQEDQPFGLGPKTTPVMKLPTFAIEDRRQMFRRPFIKPQLARLGTVAALIGVGLLLT